MINVNRFIQKSYELQYQMAQQQQQQLEQIQQQYYQTQQHFDHGILLSDTNFEKPQLDLRNTYLTNRTANVLSPEPLDPVTCLELGEKHEYDPLQSSPTVASTQSVQFTFRNQCENVAVSSPQPVDNLMTSHETFGSPTNANSLNHYARRITQEISLTDSTFDQYAQELSERAKAITHVKSSKLGEAQQSNQKKQTNEIIKQQQPYFSSRKKGQQGSSHLSMSTAASSNSASDKKNTPATVAGQQRSIFQIKRDSAPQKKRNSSRSPSCSSLMISMNNSSMLPLQSVMSPTSQSSNNSSRILLESKQKALRRGSAEKIVTVMPQKSNRSETSRIRMGHQKMASVQLNPSNDAAYFNVVIDEPIHSDRETTLSRICMNLLETQFAAAAANVEEKSQTPGKFYKSQSTTNCLMQQQQQAQPQQQQQCLQKNSARKVTLDLSNSSHLHNGGGKENVCNTMLIASATDRTNSAGKSLSKQTSTKWLPQRAGDGSIKKSNNNSYGGSNITTALSVKCVHSISQMYCYICNKNNHRKRI